MSVTTTINRNDYTGDGSTTVFAYQFLIFAAGDLQVYLTPPGGTPVLKTLTTDYSVSNVGVLTGGNVTFVVAPTSGYTVTIIRAMPYDQQTVFVDNDKFPSSSVNNALDKLTMLVQQLLEKAGRSLALSTSSLFKNVLVPDPIANNFLQWDGTGTKLQNATAVTASTAPAGTTGSLLGWLSGAFSWRTAPQARSDLSTQVTIASAATLPVTADQYQLVSGTTPVTSFATQPAGLTITLRFLGALTLTNGTTLLLQGAANYTTVPGDLFTFVSEGGGTWREVSRQIGSASTKLFNVMDARFGAKGDGVADDTAAIQSAITAAKVAGGIVYLPQGTYQVSALNLTGITTPNVVLRGAGRAASILNPTTAAVNVLDLTGSSQVQLEDFRIGTAGQTVVPTTGILLALNSGLVGNQIRIRNVLVDGKYSAAGVYVYGMTLIQMQLCSIYNRNQAAGGKAALKLTSTNVDAVTSAFATIATGTQFVNAVDLVQVDLQEFVNNGTTILDGVALLLDQANDVHIYGYGLSGNSGTAYIKVNTGISNRVTLDGVTFDSRGGTLNTANINLVGALSNFLAHNVNFNPVGTLVTGAGSITAVGPTVAARSTPATNIPAATTTFLGPAGHAASPDTQSGFLVSSPGVLTRLFVQTTAVSGAGQSYTFTVFVNGVATALTTILNNVATGSDVTDSVKVNAGDRIAVQFVSSATAAATQAMASVTFMPLQA